MPTSSGPNTLGESNLVFAYDTGDVSNSYKGEPTSNSMRQSNDLTGTQYGNNDEYSTCQLIKTYNSTIKTPIGVGATLLTEQDLGNSPWYGLNWYDGDEDGKRCLSAYIYPITSNIQLRYGMVGDGGNGVSFNLNTREITYGGGISNRNAFIEDVPGYPGWLRVGANIEGRGGGWVAFLGTGYNTYFTPSAPFQSFYICGVQYERNIATHCTQFTPAQTTRSATQGLLPLVGNSTIDLTNVSFDSNAQMTFDGTNDYVNVPYNTSHNLTSQGTISTWINPASLTQGLFAGIVSQAAGGSVNQQAYQLSWRQVSGGLYGAICNGSGTYNEAYAPFPTVANVWYNIVFTWNGAQLLIYNNGVIVGTATQTANCQVLATDLTIGGFTYKGAGGSGESFNGSISKVEILNRALTAQEIQQNYRQYKTRFNLS